MKLPALFCIISTFNSAMYSIFACVGKFSLEYCISLVIFHYLLSLKYVDSISVFNLKTISHNQTIASVQWEKLIKKCSVFINNVKRWWLLLINSLNKYISHDKLSNSVGKLMEKCSVLINNFKSGYSFRPVYSDKQLSSISKISLL